MNQQFARCCLSVLSRPVARRVRRACIFFATLFLCASLAGNAQKANSDPGLIAHEWGTFTSIAGETGLPGKIVGKVDVRERHSFVDVAAEHANAILAKLNRAEIKGHKVKIKAA